MRTLFTVLSLSLFALNAAAEEVKPLKALLITGGGWHDYENQKKILTEGVSARANVEWTIVLENPEKGALPQVYANKDWAKGYDVIVHNECFSDYTDAAGVERIVQDHVDNKVGVVMIHCAMHTFRDAKTEAWHKLIGVSSRQHGAQFPIVVRNLAPKNPITKEQPAQWKTSNGELYHTAILPSATELAVGFKEGEEESTRQVCVWSNEYEVCRVFGTTLGHHNEEMSEKVYLDTLTRGLLWSCRKLNDEGQPLEGYGKAASLHRPSKIQVYLAGGVERTFASEAEFAAAAIPEPTTPCCGQ